MLAMRHRNNKSHEDVVVNTNCIWVGVPRDTLKSFHSKRVCKVLVILQ